MNKRHLLLLAGSLCFGVACSSTNTGTDATSTTPTGTVPDAGSSAGTADMGTGATGRPTDNQAAGAGTGGTAAGSPTPGASGTATTAAANMPDATFMLTAASSNLLEIQLGKAAAQRGGNAEVKRFGQMMVDHHTKGTQDWMTVATPLGIKPPTALMPMHQEMADRVNGKSGKEFDETYMDIMEAAHKMDIAMFEAKSKAAETPSVQAFATKTLPMLQAHLTRADEIEKMVD